MAGTPLIVDPTTSQGTIVPIIKAAGRLTGLTATSGAVATFTPVVDGSFDVSANILVTTATTHAFTMTCTYTDEGNTARTLTMPFVNVAGTAIVTSVANGTGTVPYMGIKLRIRAKGANAITLLTASGGTYTTVVYNVEGTIVQVA